MNNDSIKQRITNHIEIRKNLWTANIVLLGGLATVLLNFNSVMSFILIVTGLIFEIILFQSLVYQNIRIEILLKLLENENVNL